MIIQDSLTLDASGLTFTRDGFLVGDARVSRAGNVQKYYGYELGLTGDDAHKMFGVYRDPDVVFDSTSMMSLAGRPVTRGHPKDGVTAANWKALTVGQVGGVIRRDGEHVVAPMAIMDAEAAQEVANGARALSAGYTVDVVRDEGVAPDGTPYQFRQAGALRFNHVAYLPDNNPRAGNTRIGDDGGNPKPAHKERSRPMTDNLRKVVLDGISIETTDQGAEAIAKLQKQLSDAQAAQAQANTDHTAAIAAKDTELGVKDAEIADLKGKIVDGAALDALVADRSAVVTKAKALAPTLDTAGKSNAEVKRAAVAAKVGDERVAGKSDDYVGALFDHLTVDAKTDATPDPVRDAVRDGVNVADAEKAVNDARAAMIADMKAGKAA